MCKSAIILVFVFSVVSCTKFGRTDTVKGRVYNPITGKSFADARVALLKEISSLSGGTKVVNEVLTDGEGYFEINAGRMKPLDVSVQIEQANFGLGWYKNGKLISAKYDNQVGLKKGKTLRADYHAVEYGCLQWGYKNQNCFNSNDSMVYRMRYEFEEFLDLWSTPRKGCYDQQFFKGCDQLPEGKHILEIRVYRDNGNIVFFDTLQIIGNSTVQFVLNY